MEICKKLNGLKELRKFSSLAAWKFRGLKRGLSWNFNGTDFIIPLSCKTSELPNFRKRRAFAFTMAEILISLTIIGVISVIVIPSLQANINEKTFATKRKALYSRMSQAIALMPSLNGFGEYAGTWDNHSVTVSQDTATASFITNGLGKVLELENICTVDKSASADNARAELKKCGIPSQYTKWEASSKTNFPTKLSESIFRFVDFSTMPANDYIFQNPQKNIDTRVGAFTTKNGESVAVIYNPQCVTRDMIYPEVTVGDFSAHSYYPYFCASFVFDLNGLKGPNKIGKDIWFMTAMYSTDTDLLMIEPNKIGLSRAGDSSSNYDNAVSFCANNDSRLPRKEEGFLLSYNSLLSGLSPAFWLQGASYKGNDYARGMYAGNIIDCFKTRISSFRCIKR